MDKFTYAILILAAATGLSALMACFLQFCWNQAVVPTFDAPYLSFWRTWGLMVIVGFVGRCFQPVKSSK